MNITSEDPLDWSLETYDSMSEGNVIFKEPEHNLDIHTGVNSLIWDISVEMENGETKTMKMVNLQNVAMFRYKNSEGNTIQGFGPSLKQLFVFDSQDYFKKTYSDFLKLKDVCYEQYEHFKALNMDEENDEETDKEEDYDY